MKYEQQFEALQAETMKLLTRMGLGLGLI